MKIAKYLALVVVAFVLVLGCSDGGSDDDPSEACEDLCDRYEDCNLDIFFGDLCGAICDEVDELEDEVSEDCEVAVADLFNCAADLDCDELDDIDPDEINDFGDLLEEVFAECEDEETEVERVCDE